MRKRSWLVKWLSGRMAKWPTMTGCSGNGTSDLINQPVSQPFYQFVSQSAILYPSLFDFTYLVYTITGTLIFPHLLLILDHTTKAW